MGLHLPCFAQVDSYQKIAKKCWKILPTAMNASFMWRSTTKAVLELFQVIFASVVAQTLYCCLTVLQVSEKSLHINFWFCKNTWGSNNLLHRSHNCEINKENIYMYEPEYRQCCCALHVREHQWKLPTALEKQPQYFQKFVPAERLLTKIMTRLLFY